jgi:TetR/AcrR family transcriptional regulator, transcriptional repressor of bet genes
MLEATISSIAEHGVAGASLDVIMRRVHMSTGLVAYHFGGKPKLLAAAFERLCDSYREMLGLLPGRETDFGDDVEELLQVAIRRSFEWPRRYRERQYAWFGFWALARTEPALRAVNRQMNDEVARHLARMLSAAAAKRGGAIDERTAGRELSAVIDGAWLHLTTGADDFTQEDAVAMCRRYVSTLLERDCGVDAAASIQTRGD